MKNRNQNDEKLSSFFKELIEIFDEVASDINNDPDDTHVIVVVDRGFVYVGKLSDKGREDGVFTLKEAYNIRKWGTKKGLGQLVLEGPQPDTVLDKCGTLIIPKKSIISVHPTKQELWKK